jgi:hypothetical protein
MRLDDLKKSRGLRFFSDLLYSITHQFFPPEIAKDLWTEVLRHKIELSTALGRNVRTVFAALDYLSNITSDMHSPTLAGEAVIEKIVGLSLRRRLDQPLQPHLLFSTDRPGRETFCAIWRDHFPDAYRYR